MHDARISVGLPGHPKTKKLIRRIGEGGAWRLVCLFLWVAQSRSDGDLSGMTGEDIELAADWQGEEGAFISALIEVGFVDGDEGAYAIHDWAEHNPWAAGATRRSEVARQNALKKWGGGASSENAKTRSQRLSEARTKGKHTKEEWEALKVVCGDACVKCGATELDLSKDHIVPICKGGSDGIENIQPMCHRCNSGKGGSDSADLRPQGWSELLAERLQNACEMPANFNRTPAPSPSPSPSPLPIPSTSTARAEPQTTIEKKPPKPPKPEAASDPIVLRSCELTALLTQRGAKLQASNPTVRKWAETGVSDAKALQALEIADQQRHAKGDASPVNAGYLDAILRSMDAPGGSGARASPKKSRHSGFENLDYTAGVNPDGSF